MTTKIFVSQIDKTNADGSQAPAGSLIAIGPNGAYWANSTAVSGSIVANINTAADYIWSGNNVFSNNVYTNKFLYANQISIANSIFASSVNTYNLNVTFNGSTGGNANISGNVNANNIVLSGSISVNNGISLTYGNLLAPNATGVLGALDVLGPSTAVFHANTRFNSGTVLQFNSTTGQSGQVLTTNSDGVTVWGDLSLWQINGKNANGSYANIGSYIVMGTSGRPIWTDDLAYAPVGFLGSIGYGGSIGYMGSAGNAGPGYGGSTGYQGSVGFVGSVGAGGPGVLGSVGFIGSAGFNGSTGQSGPGYTGSVGANGDDGAAGYQGSVGYMGSVPSIALTNLLDVPSSYSGKGSNFLRVNAAATGIVFDSNTYITNNMVTDVNFGYYKILNPIMHGYGEDVNTLGTVTASSPITFNPLAGGNIISVVLGDSVVGATVSTTGMISGKLYAVQMFITQDGTGSRTVDWSGMSIKWPTSENIPATGPLLSTTAGYTDVISLYTINAGATWYGLLSMKGFSA
jgi:hypothetical protein